MAFASTYATAQQGVSEGLTAFFANSVERFQKARTFRKTLNELSALPDATLADMGLHRSMLRRVAFQAVYED